MEKKDFLLLVVTLASTIFGTNNMLLKAGVWAEKHQNQEEHYHFPVLADNPWYANPLRTALAEDHNIHVYFSHEHEYYWTVLLYVGVPSASKPTVDTAPALWPDTHPPFVDAIKDMPRGARKCDKERAQAWLGQIGAVSVSARCMAHEEFADWVIQKGLANRTAVLAALQTLAESEPEKTKAAEQYVHRYRKDLDASLSFAWEKHDAPRKAMLDKLTAWEFVERAKQEHACCCGGKWMQLLESNSSYQCANWPSDVPAEEKPILAKLKAAHIRCLKEGAGKYKNVFCYGPKNAGKSFSLAPLEVVFAPSYYMARPVGKSNYPMQALLGAKVCILQDLRINTLKLGWDSYLTWWEGAPVKLPLPRNLFSEDFFYTGKAGTFCSSGSKFKISLQEALDTRTDPGEQNAMMDARWTYFAYPRMREAGDVVECMPCAHCYSNWITTDTTLSLIIRDKREAALRKRRDRQQKPSDSASATAAPASSSDGHLPVATDLDREAEIPHEEEEEAEEDPFGFGGSLDERDD